MGKDIERDREKRRSKRVIGRERERGKEREEGKSLKEK